MGKSQQLAPMQCLLIALVTCYLKAKVTGVQVDKKQWAGGAGKPAIRWFYYFLKKTVNTLTNWAAQKDGPSVYHNAEECCNAFRLIKMS